MLRLLERNRSVWRINSWWQQASSWGAVRTARGGARERNKKFEDVKNLGRALGLKYVSHKENLLDAASLSMQLASVMYNQNRFKNAEEMQLSAIEVQKEHVGESLELAEWMEKLATTYRAQKRWSEAEQVLKEAKEKWETLAGKFEKGYYIVTQNLIEVLEAQGKQEEVERLMVEREEIDWQVWSEQHLRVATSIGNRANGLYEIQKYLEAEDMHKVALQIRRSVLGDDAEEVAKSLNNLGCTLIKQSMQDKALDIQHSAIEKQKLHLEEHHPDAVVAQNNLAVIMRSCMDLQNAEALQRSVVEQMYELFIDDDLYVATAINNLAFILVGAKKYDEALELYDVAIERLRTWYDGDHRDMSDVVQSKACVLLMQGKSEEAENVYAVACGLRRAGDIVKQWEGSPEEDAFVMVRARGKYQRAFNKLNPPPERRFRNPGGGKSEPDWEDYD
ncbi:hypothetical protein BSKO_06946 [Bryopsis sp. KO-2023]|nr:hypothetical protein BSKO_06946 [Bryopsis sp. KO-2023]